MSEPTTTITKRFDGGVPAIISTIEYTPVHPDGDHTLDNHLRITLRDDYITQWQATIEDATDGIFRRQNMIALTLETYGRAEADTLTRVVEDLARELRRIVHNDTDIEQQMRTNRFRLYLNEFMQQYHDTASLDGIATIARRHGVTALSRDLFRAAHLSEVTAWDLDTAVWYDYEALLYQYLLGKSSALPVWQHDPDPKQQLGTYTLQAADPVPPAPSDTPTAEQQYDDTIRAALARKSDLATDIQSIDKAQAASQRRISELEAQLAALTVLD